MPKKRQPAEPRRVTPDAVDPRHAWDRPLQAPGHTQVDFEERVDFRRLHGYRLGRVRQALAGSGLGALLVFDQHNIRYISSTVIGEWARDKLTRWCLLAGERVLGREPGRVEPVVAGLFKAAAREIKAIL